jgi:hypothetical protein
MPLLAASLLKAVSQESKLPVPQGAAASVGSVVKISAAPSAQAPRRRR